MDSRFVRVTNVEGGAHILNLAHIVVLNPEGPNWKVTMTIPCDIVLSQAEVKKIVGVAF